MPASPGRAQNLSVSRPRPSSNSVGSNARAAGSAAVAICRSNAGKACLRCLAHALLLAHALVTCSRHMLLAHALLRCALKQCRVQHSGRSEMATKLMPIAEAGDDAGMARIGDGAYAWKVSPTHVDLSMTPATPVLATITAEPQTITIDLKRS